MTSERSNARPLSGRALCALAGLWGAVAGGIFDYAFTVQKVTDEMVGNSFAAGLFFAIPGGAALGVVCMALGILAARIKQITTVEWAASLVCAVVVLMTSTTGVILLLANELFNPGSSIWFPLGACALGSLALCFVRIGRHKPWTWGARPTR